MLEVVGAGAALERTEGDATPRQRRDVAELVRTDRLRLVRDRDYLAVPLAVRVFARRAVVLVGRPGGVRRRTLVNREAVGPTRVELEPDVRDVERLSCEQDKGTREQQ